MTVWDQDRTEALKTMWAEGLSGSTIAARFGVTRNSIIGKANRLGLHRKDGKRFNRQKRKRVLVPRPKLREERKPLTRAAVVESLHKSPAPLPDPATDLPPLVAFADLEDHHCRWIPGEPKEGCCGRQKVPGLPYCAPHATRAYEPRSPGRKPPTTARISGSTYAKIKADHAFLMAVEEMTAP